MAWSSIRERIMKLENQCRFLDWFVWQRFRVALTLEEIDTYRREGKFPDPTPNRPSSLDTLDRKSLLKLREEDEQTFGGRTQEELEFYPENSFFRSKEVGSTSRFKYLQSCPWRGFWAASRKALHGPAAVAANAFPG